MFPSFQIHSTSSYRCWGHTLPQSSIEHDVIEKATRSICESCKSRGVIGYISIDFVTFIDPASVYGNSILHSNTILAKIPTVLIEKTSYPLNNLQKESSSPKKTSKRIDDSR